MNKLFVSPFTILVASKAKICLTVELFFKLNILFCILPLVLVTYEMS